MCSHGGACKTGHTDKEEEEVKVAACVNILRTVHLLPHQSIAVQVKIEPSDGDGRPLLVECDSDLEMITGLLVEDALVKPTEEGLAHVVISNMTGCSSYVSSGALIGRAIKVEVVEQSKSAASDLGNTPIEEKQTQEPLLVRNIKSVDDRKRELRRWVGKPKLLNEKHAQELLDLITHHHTAFCLDEEERGETDLVEMEIHTNDVAPRKIAARRMLFAVWQEVAKQLQRMQGGVIEPSDSPWSSPVVMVRKKDESLRFCVDYRELNRVTRKDTYPLPQVDDLLDQVGQS